MRRANAVSSSISSKVSLLLLLVGLGFLEARNDRGRPSRSSSTLVHRPITTPPIEG